jgi:hypothetical protein
MKLAWICYTHGHEDDDEAVILFYEPESYRYDKVVPIVYAEIVE